MRLAATDPTVILEARKARTSRIQGPRVRQPTSSCWAHQGKPEGDSAFWR